MLCLVRFIRNGNQCRDVLKIISRCQRPICISRFIRRLSDQVEILSKFKFVLMKCIKSLSSGLQLTGPTKKARLISRKQHKITSSWIGSVRSSSCRMKATMRLNLWKALKAIFSAIRFMCLPLKVM